MDHEKKWIRENKTLAYSFFFDVYGRQKSHPGKLT